MLRRLAILLVALFGLAVVVLQLVWNGVIPAPAAPAAPAAQVTRAPSAAPVQATPAATPAQPAATPIVEAGEPLAAAAAPAPVVAAPPRAVSRPAVAFESAEDADRRARQPVPLKTAQEPPTRSAAPASAAAEVPEQRTVADGPPSAPAVVQVRSSSESSAVLSWSAATGAGGVASYDVVRAGAVVATSTSPRAVESGLLAGRTYCWTVRARDAAGRTSRDSPEACLTVRDQTPPAPPSGLVAGPAATDRVAFAWRPSDDDVGVDRYEVLRDGHLVTRTGASRVSGVEAGLTPSTEHCYTVVAVDAAGNRSRPSAAACAVTAAPGVPSGPTELALAPSPRAGNAVVLRWEPSPEPGVVYTVYWDGHRRIGATPRTEYTVVGLKPGERRCFRVSAVDAAGQESPATLEACLGGAVASR